MRALLPWLALLGIIALCVLVGVSLGLLARAAGLHLTTTEAGVLFCCMAIGYVLWLCCRR